jgi:hypothetical protein
MEEEADLQAAVQEALEADLGPEGSGRLTRTLCARAVQYEILREELGPLVEETEKDGKLGCFTQPLTWQTSRSLEPVIAELRRFDDGERPHADEKGTPLPKRLGSDVPDEATSNLAMRTIAQTLLVVLAALTNTLKHSQASRATVLIRYTPDELEIEVADNGRGGAADEAGGGNGIIGMRERAALVGGELRVGPAPAGGFAVNARIPLEEAEA